MLGEPRQSSSDSDKGAPYKLALLLCLATPYKSPSIPKKVSAKTKKRFVKGGVDSRTK